MKNIDDYNVPLVHLQSYHHMPHDQAPGKQIIRRRELMAKEGAKQFEATCGKRIKKTDLTVIKGEDTRLYHHFSAYCLPDQVIEVAEKMAQMIREDLQRTLSYLQSLYNTAEQAHSVLDEAEYKNFIFGISNQRKSEKP